VIFTTQESSGKESKKESKKQERKYVVRRTPRVAARNMRFFEFFSYMFYITISRRAKRGGTCIRAFSILQHSNTTTQHYNTTQQYYNTAEIANLCIVFTWGSMGAVLVYPCTDMCTWLTCSLHQRRYNLPCFGFGGGSRGVAHVGAGGCQHSDAIIYRCQHSATNDVRYSRNSHAVPVC